MIKILSAEQLRQADFFTIKNEPISSYHLMERAAIACVDWILNNLNQIIENDNPAFQVICGTGNNGGDGLVIARHLLEKGYSVNIIILRLGEGTDDFNKNLRLIDEKHITDVHSSHFEQIEIKDSDLTIDCIFGTGLSRPVEGSLANVFHQINEEDSIKISIDLPSGLFPDLPTTGAVVRAHHVLTFEVPKLAFFMPENSIYVQHFHLIPIGLDEKFIDQVETPFYLIASSSVKSILKSRDPFAHKGNFGHALLVCGEKGKWGATILGAKACLRSGVGKLSIYCDEEALPVLQQSVPEAMCFTDLELIGRQAFDSVGIGPGLGTEKKSAQKMEQVLTKWNKEAVIDADAINLISSNKELWNLIHPQSIFTPHIGEFDRLMGLHETSFERISSQMNLSKEHGIITLLKGKYSSSCDEIGMLYFNSTGNAGMAKAGSGDVLTGILTGLMAQGYSSIESSILGAWIHGLSGDIARNLLSEESMIAGDLVNNLYGAFNEIEN